MSYKQLDPIDDRLITTTKVTTLASGNLPADSDGNNSTLPAGYETQASTFLTWNDTNNIPLVDLAWGFRTGALADKDSIFYLMDGDRTNWGGDSIFNAAGIEAMKTSSMVYASLASTLNDGDAFDFEGTNVDLILVANMNRRSYREQVAAGSFQMTYRASGTFEKIADWADETSYDKITVADEGAVTTITTKAGKVSNIKPTVGGPGGDKDIVVGKLYQDYGIAVFDLVKMFFTRSADRKDIILPMSGNDSGTSDCSKHGLCFFTGAGADHDGVVNGLYGDVVAAAAFNSFNSGTYSSSLAILARDIHGLRFNSEVNFQTSIFFCRALNQEFNFSNNPTFSTGSEKVPRTPEPVTYITKVGLYNENNELLAVGSLSQPLKKNFGREAVVRTRLDF